MAEPLPLPVHGPMNFEFACRADPRFVLIDAAPAAAAEATEGAGDEAFLPRPEDRGALFHAVEITVDADGGDPVPQAFDPVAGRARIAFGA